MAGPLFENFVIQEIVKLYYNKGKRPNIYYMRTHNQLEIDLIVERNFEIYPIEIKLSKTLNTAMAKPMERFRKLFTGLKINTGVIVSLAEEKIPITKNVTSLSVESLLEMLKNII